MSKIGDSLYRLPNWEGALFRFFQETDSNALTFDWESANCGAWTCEAFKAITGYDLYEEFRPIICSPISAYKAVKLAGYDSLETLVASRLEAIPRAMARPGDLCLRPVESDLCGIPGPSAVMLRLGAPNAFPTASSPGISYAMCIADPPHVWAMIDTGRVALPSTPDCLYFKIGQ
jgi:hypothetical protein